MTISNIYGIYIDATIYWSPDYTKIDQPISELEVLDFDLIYEGVVDTFLGINIDTAEDGTIHVTQPALIQIIIDMFREWL